MPGLSSSAPNSSEPPAIAVNVFVDTLEVRLSDGRKISVPLSWYPRLAHASVEERSNWQMIGPGLGIHWPDIDEDISVENLLLGQPSGESQKSFERWLGKRS